MKKSGDIQIGKTYIVKVSGHLTPVRLESVSPYGGWAGRNVRTGREVRIRTAAKLRREYVPLTAEERLQAAECKLLAQCNAEPEVK